MAAFWDEVTAYLEFRADERSRDFVFLPTSDDDPNAAVWGEAVIEVQSLQIEWSA